MGWVPHLPTGGTCAADGTGTTTTPAGVAVFRVRHCAGGGETLVDDGVAIVTHLADDRVAALRERGTPPRCDGETLTTAAGWSGNRTTVITAHAIMLCYGMDCILFI